MLAIKILLSAFAVLGLLISLLEMLGRFRDKDRVDFIKIMEANLECPKDHPGAKKFLKDFVYGDPDFENFQDHLADVDKIVFVGTWTGSSSEADGRRVDSVMSGSVKLRSLRGDVTKSLCSFEELRNWSKESPLWKWLGWWIVAISIFLGIALLIMEEIAKLNNTA